ncbi:MAG TPA: hypothetical protein PKC28_03605 [Bdellovibrionales bacterium]|nr:hypothetical protein [Bdellovibrionales bacterium]
MQSRADLSQFLIHLTRNGSYQVYEPFRRNPGHYLFRGGDTQEAKTALASILSEKTIRARAPFGHFKFQIPVGYQNRGMMPLEWLQCVCFSETPISELRSFYKATHSFDRAADIRYFTSPPTEMTRSPPSTRSAHRPTEKLLAPCCRYASPSGANGTPTARFKKAPWIFGGNANGAVLATSDLNTPKQLSVFVQHTRSTKWNAR